MEIIILCLFIIFFPQSLIVAVILLFLALLGGIFAGLECIWNKIKEFFK